MGLASPSNRFERVSTPERRVVVTGMGCVTPLGLDLSSSWKAAVAGQSGIGAITQFDASQYDVRFAGEVKGFDPSTVIEKKEQKKMARFIHLAISAADQAFRDSGLDPALFSDEFRARIGAIVGVGIGGINELEQAGVVIKERGPGRISPFLIPSVIANMASGNITIKYGLKGVNYSVTSACSSGAHSIGEATNYIRRGLADVMLAGGAEAAIGPLGIGGFAAMKALSTRNDQPAMASRPFDRDRDGFVLSEAGAMLILEDFEHASRRGAKIYGEVAGYGSSSDAHHMTNPAPGGVGAALAMKVALADAHLNPEEIQYINAHGTSTPAGDGQETGAVKSVFTSHAKKLWVSSTKSVMGHSLGAAGAIESVFSIMALHTNTAPPTINLDHPSDDCDLDYVPHVAREGRFSAVMNNSFGFGGTNSCLVFTKAP
ncbi:MAG: beta-ketoacyl-ACP synthase II [Bdellovibrionaceae bacterium]|nr:beta-ketoacyl-ACP synthase II [Pseudobdellovibrionaceae bacterium]